MHRILKLDNVWFSHSVVFDPFVTPWTAAHQAPLSLGFSRQESWSGLPFPSLGDLPNPGIEPVSPALQADSLPLKHWGSPIRQYRLIRNTPPQMQ